MARHRSVRAPFDPSITQEVTKTLRAAGREDLVDRLAQVDIKDLKEQLEEVRRRSISESGVRRVLYAGAVDWLKWGTRVVLTGIVAIILRLAWKGMH